MNNESKKPGKFIGCTLITLAMWCICQFIPLFTGNALNSSLYVKGTAMLILLFLGWLAAKAIAKGKFEKCIKVNLWIFAGISIIDCITNLLYVISNWPNDPRYHADVNGILYEDYFSIFGVVILFKAAHALLCLYLAKKSSAEIE